MDQVGRLTSLDTVPFIYVGILIETDILVASRRFELLFDPGNGFLTLKSMQLFRLILKDILLGERRGHTVRDRLGILDRRVCVV